MRSKTYSNFQERTRNQQLRIDVLTLFPPMFAGPFRNSMVAIAKRKGLAKIRVHDLRKFSTDKKHRKCDDKPFGGGPGMVMMADPLFRGIETLKKTSPKAKVVLMCPQGKPYNQKMARAFADEEHLIFVCGHYEGVDERVRENIVDEEVSVGDFVVTGGELPAMLVVDSIVRLIPGVVGNAESIEHESFESDLLDYPHYTRPQVFRDMVVPAELVSGNQKLMEDWRKMQAIRRTKQRRPDLHERYLAKKNKNG